MKISKNDLRQLIKEELRQSSSVLLETPELDENMHQAPADDKDPENRSIIWPHSRSSFTICYRTMRILNHGFRQRLPRQLIILRRLLNRLLMKKDQAREI